MGGDLFPSSHRPAPTIGCWCCVSRSNVEYAFHLRQQVIYCDNAKIKTDHPCPDMAQAPWQLSTRESHQGCAQIFLRLDVMDHVLRQSHDRRIRPEIEGKHCLPLFAFDHFEGWFWTILDLDFSNSSRCSDLQLRLS